MNFIKLKIMMEDYNQTITRILMATHYLDDNNVPLAEREKFTEKFKEIVQHSDIILKTLDNNGIKYDEHEIMQGFNIEYRKKRYEKHNY